MTAATSPPPADRVPLRAGAATPCAALPNDRPLPGVRAGGRRRQLQAAASRPPRLAATPTRDGCGGRCWGRGCWSASAAISPGFTGRDAWRQLVPAADLPVLGVLRRCLQPSRRTPPGIGGGLLFLPVLRTPDKCGGRVAGRGAGRRLDGLGSTPSGPIVRWVDIVSVIFKAPALNGRGRAASIAWISLWFVPALLVNAAGCAGESGRPLPAGCRRGGCGRQAARAGGRFRRCRVIEVVRVIALGPDLQFGGSDAPLLLDLYEPGCTFAETCRASRQPLRLLPRRFHPRLRANRRYEYGWAVSISGRCAASTANRRGLVRRPRHAGVARGGAGAGRRMDTDADTDPQRISTVQKETLGLQTCTARANDPAAEAQISF